MQKQLFVVIALSFVCGACTLRVPDSMRTGYSQVAPQVTPAAAASTSDEIFSVYKEFIGDATYTTQASASAQIQTNTTVMGTKLTAVKTTEKAGAYYTQIDDPTILHQHGFEQETALSADGHIGSQWGFVKRLPEKKIQILLISYSFPAPAMTNDQTGKGETPDNMTYEVFLSDPMDELALR